MKYFINAVSGFIAAVCWVAGMVIAKGFWSTIFAIFLPPWGWYLIAERLLILYGIV